MDFFHIFSNTLFIQRTKLRRCIS